MPTDLNGVLVILLAIIPGYIANGVWSRARTRQVPRSDLYTILQSVTLSLVVHIVAAPLSFWWIYPYRADVFKVPSVRLIAWFIVVVLAIPVLLGLMLRGIENRYLDVTGGSRHSTAGPAWMKPLALWLWPPSPPSTWDTFFASSIPSGSWIVIQFLEGSRVAGTWEAGSYATTSPEPHSLFMKTEWTVDDHGNLVRPVPHSTGILVPSDSNILSMRAIK